MTSHSRRLQLKALAALAGLSGAAGAFAQSGPGGYPTREIRFIVPFPPGGGNDILARMLGPKMAEALGKPVVIDNRPGAGGNLGTDQAARSPADGYTIVIASNQVTINPGLGQKLPFDIERNFSPVALVASVPMLLVVHPSVPVNNVAELIALARSQPARLNHATPGNGTPQHLAFELLNKLAKIEVTHVPYKGTGPAVADLLGGQVQAAFATLASVAQHVRSGKLRAIAVAPAQRSPLMPEVPTVAESGVPGYDVPLWYSILAPSGTPAEAVERLSGELRRIVESPDTRDRMVNQGFQPGFVGPAALQAMIRDDVQRWQAIGRDTGIRIE
ncbi:MAG: tripartite tricarboxylate transporter substrate binding protein [Betaproteobacteria bacterium]|nr:tripartite tricarboxylate transporter substrate binding protein [Betaproteobacteria bacterium]